MPHTPHITASSAISRIADGGMAVYNSRLVSKPALSKVEGNHSGGGNTFSPTYGCRSG